MFLNSYTSHTYILHVLVAQSKLCITVHVHFLKVRTNHNFEEKVLLSQSAYVINFKKYAI